MQALGDMIKLQSDDTKSTEKQSPWFISIYRKYVSAAVAA
jgi:hypothetical protein